MTVQEQVTIQRVFQALYATIASDTTTAGAIIDTAKYDMGIYFTLNVVAWTDGTYTLKIEHGDEDDLSDAEDVTDAMLVYGTLPVSAAEDADGDALPREGVHSTKRYVRASIVSTDFVSGGATVSVNAILGAEEMPTPQDD